MGICIKRLKLLYIKMMRLKKGIVFLFTLEVFNMRHAVPTVVYAGTDITANILPFLQSFEYSEAAEGSGDSLSITLSNVDLRWLNAWFPQPGDEILAQLTQYDWDKPGSVKVLNCGQMMVDSPVFRGPPDTLDLKALQIPSDLGFSDTPQDTTFSDLSMSQLAQQIAQKYNMTLQYLAPTDIILHALKRTKQSDSDLLNTVAKKYNLAVKVYNNRLVIYSPMVAEQATPVETITLGLSNIQDYELEAPLVGTNYSACLIKYKPPKSKQMLQYLYPPGTTTGKILIYQMAVDDDSQAEMVAQGKLREANIKAHTATLTLGLDLNLVAGCTVTLEGWGDAFSGLFFVDKCVHSYGKSAGTSQLTLHKCLVGY